MSGNASFVGPQEKPMNDAALSSRDAEERVRGCEGVVCRAEIPGEEAAGDDTNRAENANGCEEDSSKDGRWPDGGALDSG